MKHAEYVPQSAGPLFTGPKLTITTLVTIPCPKLQVRKLTEVK